MTISNPASVVGPKRNSKADLTVIGAGPAGMAAAVTASQAGADVVVIDEGPRPGGQIGRATTHRNSASDFFKPGPYDSRLTSLTQSFAEQSLRYLPGTTVWGIFDGRVVATDHRTHTLIESEYLLIANGAYETPVPFPGWTLSGVMTVGGLQQLQKVQRVVPKGRVLLSGTGPFLYLAADQLASAGVEIVAVADSASFPELARWAARLVRLPVLLMEGLGYLTRLRSRGVPLLYRHAVTRTMGEGRVRAAEVTELDDQFQPRPGTERQYSVDVVAVNHGFTPATELTHMAACDHVLDITTHHWLPVLDERQRTTQPWIYAAGDCAGIGYLPRNLLQGELAGTDVAIRLGLIPESEANRRAIRLQRKLRASTWYLELLAEIYSFRPGRVNWADSETIVCRCEGVRREVVEKSMAAQISVELDAVKRLSRAGMGQCQGKLCFPTILGMLSQEMGSRRFQEQDFTARPPLKPIPMQKLADLAEGTSVMGLGDAS